MNRVRRNRWWLSSFGWNTPSSRKCTSCNSTSVRRSDNACLLLQLWEVDIRGICILFISCLNCNIFYMVQVKIHVRIGMIVIANKTCFCNLVKNDFFFI
jgi:hypothetical protein